jgi:hypothetical protein
MKFRVLAAVLALGLSIGAAQAAAPQLTVPYQPSGMASALLESVNVWGEVYPVSPAGVEAALGRALQGQSPADQVAAVVIDSTLHFAIGRANEQLPEASSKMERKGSPIEYDEKCGVTPEKGDRLIATYGKFNNLLSAELDVRVVRYLPFSDESDEPLDLAKPGVCEQETHSRMFLSGVLRIKRAGKLQQEVPVLLQSIVEPRS